MSTARPVIIEPGAGPQHNVLGDLVTVKIHGRDTGGVYSQIETVCGPKFGPPPHIHHREDETFFVIEGEFEFVCAGERITGGAGTIARLPRGVAHRFANIGDTPGRVLVTITPAGFEDFFVEVGALSPEQQAEMPRIGALAERYGLEFVANA
jgi:mannose-6-phosphate isomerase-like protein (cupin superfamily)